MKIISKLYKSVVVLSFAVMLIGIILNITDLAKARSIATTSDIIQHRVDSKLDVLIYSDPTAFEESLVLKDKQILSKLLFLYEWKTTSWILMLIGQFFLLLAVKKWASWVAS